MHEGFEWKMVNSKTNEVVAEGKTASTYDLKTSSMSDEEMLYMLDQNIDMALATNDRSWFMELASQRNDLLKKMEEEIRWGK
ncbi:IDEAL domain-containing protein [Priestia sp. SB1]|uniref:IDEAL domain-containing protein n=1 Tax=Priestia sp. SB1 TaxID=3132359 RepID=UPI003172CD12